MGVQTLGQEVAERLRRDLAEGAFKPGEKLPPERELMARYSVGRNTVREAVRGLVALGMLEVKAGSGTTVSRIDGRTALARTVGDRPMDESALEDLVEFRLLLEGQAAQLAAERATPEDLERIREGLAAYQNAVRRHEAVYEHDVAFHRAVSQAAHNRLFLDVIDTSSQLFQGAMQAADHSPEDLLKAAEEHAMVAHHVLMGDAEAAGRAMRAHILAGNGRRLKGTATRTTSGAPSTT
ncbi:FadR/GntR family transcriptional regulator [Streptacidiphilus sp. N1-10]|uniref:FadR/GntR family transcriptional regulator n=1 Tax=Streptacidiphilus jeojiensis TaxID=3229225 RepID=A0ABV6XGT3_9ACTN